jgi:UDP-GlcNAc:undecaprenyl-phosphate/decaprenyl-phosphate GlcNAc-1-phosphate transferase
MSVQLVLPVLVAMFVTFVTILLMKFLAPRLHLVDEPHNGRKQHANPTPVVGGIGITAGIFSLCITQPDFFLQHWVIFASIVVVMILGILDDMSHIHSAVRMLIQIGIGCAIYFEGDLPFRSVGDIWFIGDLGLGPYSLTFTCIAVVGGVNAINMMDGLDGLCGLMVVSALSLLAGMAYVVGHADVLVLSLILLSSVVVFLGFNYRFPWNGSARVFLGDSGTYVLGFMIAALFLMASQGPYKGDIQVLTPVTALWLLFIPLVDIAGVIWRRSRGGRWPVDDDREHLHYMLVDRGYSTEQVVNGLFVSALLLGSIGVALFYLGVTESWSYVAFMSACVGYFVWTNRMARRD